MTLLSCSSVCVPCTPLPKGSRGLESVHNAQQRIHFRNVYHYDVNKISILLYISCSGMRTDPLSFHGEEEEGMQHARPHMVRKFLAAIEKYTHISPTQLRLMSSCNF